MKVRVACPYCGMKTELEVEELRNISNLVNCDIMEGGCDGLFVADVSVKVTAAARKVEGEGGNND